MDVPVVQTDQLVVAVCVALINDKLGLLLVFLKTRSSTVL